MKENRETMKLFPVRGVSTSAGLLKHVHCRASADPGSVLPLHTDPVSDLSPASEAQHISKVSTISDHIS
ncbi:hypothetical protein CgunFtcFv8_018973 [Champsocephalus gunnari]|uniref:Uncharacterized protein n=1 Tax=Champsocephalus gunnari TaxID=52237 RepID=A0AAN8HNA0_CHAGU|nr:hypothetical protein CgunFtcFv8_018973 [Champsocephalus gunnari]